MTKNNKKFKRPTKVSDLENMDLYWKSPCGDTNYWVGQQYIVTFQDGEQIAFENCFALTRWAENDAEEFESVCLMGALQKIIEHEKCTQLAKISSCTGYIGRYEKREQKIIKEFAEKQDGKWYFQPDQRGKVEQWWLEFHWGVSGTPLCRDTVPVQEMVFA